MRILITGCAGYIGSYLSTLLCSYKLHVIGIDNLRYNNFQSINHLLVNPLYQPYFTFINKDVSNPDVSDYDCDVVVHLAALVGAPICDKNLEEAIEVNTHGVTNYLFPGKKHIYPNTNSLYGATSGVELCTELTEVNPISHYARTKLEAEREVLAEGGVSLRLATVFGISPRMRLDLLVNDFTHQAFFNKHIKLYEDHALRNYVHVSDVAKCMIFAISNYDRMCGECFNLGNDMCNATKGQLVETIKQYIPDLQIEKQEGTDPDKRNYQVSSNKLEQVGFVAQTSLSQGIKELVKYFKTWPPNLSKEGMYNCS